MDPPIPSSKTWWARKITWIATGIGFGYAPVAPGTVGAIWGIPLAWLVAHLHLPAQVAVLIGLYLIGIPICTTAARHLQKKDPGEVVWDEIATVPIAFVGLSDTLLARPWLLLVGFAFHRFFDILKPAPVRNLERLPDGIGIMTDDVAAGIYACLAMHALTWIMH